MSVPFPRQFQEGATGPDCRAVKRALVARMVLLKQPGAATTYGMDLRTNAFLDPSGDVLAAAKKLDGFVEDPLYTAEYHAKLVAHSCFDAFGVSLMQQEVYILGGGDYQNPFRAIPNIVFLGYDQGADFGGQGAIYACGPAVVTTSTRSSGWPGGGAISYRFTSGKANGLTVYLAENIIPRVNAGETVDSNTVIADLILGYPDCETGWAQDGTDNPMAQPITHSPSYFGANFGMFLRSLGVVCPVSWGGSDQPLPPDWPTWT